LIGSRFLGASILQYKAAFRRGTLHTNQTMTIRRPSVYGVKSLERNFPHMADKTKIDPLDKRYFKPLGLAERLADFLFCVSVLFSFAVMFINEPDFPSIFSIVQIGFILTVIALFVVNLYFS
jgi:hypothetical protein